MVVFFSKQRAAYEMRIHDWSSDVWSSDRARAIPGAAAGEQFAVWGESQGGHAALWAAIAAKSYAPELRLVGTAAAAPPSDLADNMRKASEPNVRALLMGFTMYSWSQRFGYSMDGVVGKTNQDVTDRKSTRLNSSH